VTRTIADSLRLASERELSRAELIERSGLKPGILDGLATVGLIEPVERAGRVVYSPLDARIVLAFVRILEAGATPERGFVGSPDIIDAYRTHLTELARVEAREMVRMMRPLAEIDLEELLAKIADPLGEMIAAMHRKALVQAVGDVAARDDTEN
jgi:hypothetical protein